MTLEKKELPLRQARRIAGKTLESVCREMGAIDVHIDVGNLSRIERGKQTPSPTVVQALAAVFAKQGLTELHILYPDRFEDQPLTPKEKRAKARRKQNRRTGKDRRDPAGRGRRADDASATPLES